MAERDQLLRALKQVLKLRGMRYSDLARGLGVSEPTVKRMLSTGRIDLARLERICGLLDIDLFELVRVARGARAEREHLEPVQEEALAADPRLLLVFHLLGNDWKVPAIRREFGLDVPEMTLLLARLDRLRLVELLPRERVRRCASRWVAALAPPAPRSNISNPCRLVHSPPIRAGCLSSTYWATTGRCLRFAASSGSVCRR